MGLDYSFEMVLHKRDLNTFLEELCKHLCEHDRLRLLECLPWAPEVEKNRSCVGKDLIKECIGINGLRSMKEEDENDYCFSMLFKRDEILREYEAEYNDSSEIDKVAIGCIWTSVYGGNKLAVITFTAATTRMSLLFLSSPEIRETWTDLARDTNSLALFFDTEEGDEWYLNYPRMEKVERPYDEPYSIDNALHLNVDEYYHEVLTMAGINYKAV